MRGRRGRGNKGRGARGGANKPIRFVGGGTLNAETSNSTPTEYGGYEDSPDYPPQENYAIDFNKAGTDSNGGAGASGQSAARYSVDLGTGLGKKEQPTSTVQDQEKSSECKAYEELPDLELGGKNPISVLTELFHPGPDAWTYKDVNPGSKPKVYLCTFLHETDQYQGQAAKKQEAKYNAAYQFLQVLGWTPGYKKPVKEEADPPMDVKTEAPEQETTTPDRVSHPMMRLNEFWPGKLIVTCDKGPPFTTTITVADLPQAFSGTGPNKKVSKLAAAAKFLLAIDSGEVVPPPKAPKVERGAKRSIDGEPRLTSSLNQITEIYGETLKWEVELVEDVYTIKLEVDDKTYTATGAAEKAAQQMIASEIISDIESGEIKAPEGAKAIIQAADLPPPPKRAKHDPNSPQTNPICQVMQHYRGLTMTYEGSGPIHSPVFTAAVELEEHSFTGRGRTKKEAKMTLCENILAAINSFEITPPPPRVAAKRQPKVEDDPNADPKMPQAKQHNERSEVHQIFGSTLSYDKTVMAGPPHNPTVTTVAMIGDKPFAASGTSIAAAKTNCCKMILEALANGELQRPTKPAASCEAELQRAATAANHEVKFNSRNMKRTAGPVFICDVTIDGKTFSGSGRNIRVAKKNACAVALSECYNIQLRDLVGKEDSAEMVDTEDGDIGDMDPQHLSYVIQKIMLKEFDEVAANLTESEAAWKVLAGCAVTRDDDADTAKIIGLATGTKCIQGLKLSAEGLALNDMHAEILVRRTLKVYLLEQIEMARAGQNESVVRKHGALYELKPKVRFHLFVSSPPCGDSRIFSISDDTLRKNTSSDTLTEGEPMETTADPSSDDLGFDVPTKSSNLKKRGLLRVKLEEGEGTIPVTSENVVKLQTWDGTIGGERLQIMSCSDKVARSTVIGFQGALLSTLMKPVYYSSIVIGSLYRFSHLYRGLYGRFSGVREMLTGGFVPNSPFIIGVFSPEPKHSKAPSHAVIHKGDITEVIHTPSGKKNKARDESSSFCKAKLFQKYREIYLSIFGRAAPESYFQAKKRATLYQANKKILNGYTKTTGLGVWNKIPEESDQFV